MIFSYHVKWSAERVLRQVLANYPSQLRVCLEDEKFGKWCRLCAEKLNQLDIAGYVRSQYAIDHFIKVAALAYARYQIEKASLQIPKNSPA